MEDNTVSHKPKHLQKKQKSNSGFYVTLIVLMGILLGVAGWKIYDLHDRNNELEQLQTEDQASIQELEEKLDEKSKLAEKTAAELQTNKDTLAGVQEELNTTKEDLTETQEDLEKAQEALSVAEKELVKQIEANKKLQREYEMTSSADPLVLGTFSTNYRTGGGRGENIRIATEAINGKIILPGESLSFNSSTGPRSPGNGYKLAHVLVNGEYVDGYGGGVCQVSTTLYNAALLSGMGIDQRANHSKKSAYVAPGRDATVADNLLDLVIRNDYNYPVMINSSVDNGVCTVSVLSTEAKRAPSVKVSVDKQGAHTYMLYRSVDGTINYTAKSVYQD